MEAGEAQLANEKEKKKKNDTDAAEDMQTEALKRVCKCKSMASAEACSFGPKKQASMAMNEYCEMRRKDQEKRREIEMRRLENQESLEARRLKLEEEKFQHQKELEKAQQLEREKENEHRREMDIKREKQMELLFQLIQSKM
eukprot:GCRY01004863.1.p1 GENE.GCRY01004863.1~~GCRY01004863.1.p1  ORF type:complete len:142 (-),score=33.19 GCRY01004863.1:1474-1899(-)